MRPRRTAIALALALLLQGGGVAAQEPSAAAPLSEEVRARLQELEAQLAETRARAEEWRSKSAEYREARDGASARLQAIEAEIAALGKDAPVEIAPDATRGDLETLLLSAEQDLALVRKEAAELEAEAARRAERRKRIPELLAAAKERLRALGEEPVAQGQPAALLEAWQRLADARRAALEAEIQAYENELASYEARGQLLVKRLDRATLRATREELRVARLRAALTARQQAEGQEAEEQARQRLAEAEALPPAAQGVVRTLAEQNATLAGQRTGSEGLVEKIDKVSRKLARAESSVAAVEADLTRLVSKVEAAGLTESVGMLLRRQRSDAPDVGKYRRFVRMRQDEISDVQLHQMELREQRSQLADIDKIVANALSGVDASLGPAEREQLEVLLRDLLETKRRYLDELIADYETYFQKLVDFDAKQLELVDRTEQLLRYIDARLLWIPSGKAVRSGLLSDGAAALGWLFAPRFRAQLGRAALDAGLAAPVLNAAILLLFVLGLALRPRIRARIQALGEEARSPACTRVAPTWEALLLSLLLTIWLPGLLAYAGWRIGLSPLATQYARCVAGGFVAAALFWISLEVPRQLLRPHGIAEDHFDWDAAAVRKLRRWLTGLVGVGVPAVFVIQVFELRGEDAWSESIGRAIFLLLLGLGAIFAHRALRESGPVERIVYGSVRPARRSWPWRLTHGASLALPLFLMAATARGFYWTALRLGARGHFTLVVLAVVAVAYFVCVRWSRLARKRMALEQARERSQALAAQPEPLAGEAGVEPSEPQVDLVQADRQTSRLLRSTALLAGALGTLLIWADVLPAAGVLSDVELWNTTRKVVVEVADAEGQLRTATEDRLVPVTLADVGLAILIALATLIVARNLPGLVEIALPRGLGLGPGERYAIATIGKYGATLTGLVLAVRPLGVGWSNVQWLVAALGLGLGFGLQEIFANFVSGLIILFERPIRVGDTVTVGDVSGTVTKIRIRATWITGFDRKELVVPNKEFVTSRLVNWSLSDSVLRIQVPVGIAYGSDTNKAIAVLRRVAAENPNVLKEPEPQVLFLGFGESSLDFELRVFSPDVAHLLPIRHELHVAIDDAFRSEGIEIAFPQRDLHVRSLPPGGAPLSPGTLPGPD